MHTILINESSTIVPTWSRSFYFCSFSSSNLVFFLLYILAAAFWCNKE